VGSPAWDLRPLGATLGCCLLADGQIITYSDVSDSTRAFDSHGNLIPVPSYQKFELGTYLEYGLTVGYPSDNAVMSIRVDTTPS
jgi:hypothetical protein